MLHLASALATTLALFLRPRMRCGCMSRTKNQRQWLKAELIVELLFLPLTDVLYVVLNFFRIDLSSRSRTHTFIHTQRVLGFWKNLYGVVFERKKKRSAIFASKRSNSFLWGSLNTTKCIFLIFYWINTSETLFSI